jgi:hypothetical protein
MKVSDTVIFWVLIIFLVVITLAVIGISKIPGTQTNSNPVYIFIYTFLSLLVGAFVIYAIVNLIFKPLFGMSELSYAMAIFYYIVIAVIIIALGSLFYPNRVGIMA